VNRLRKSEVLEGWYVLDVEGTNCRSQPEGTREEWLILFDQALDPGEMILGACRSGGRGMMATERVGVRMVKHNVLEFYSPRNALDEHDFVSVLMEDIPSMIAVLITPTLHFESVDQAQIEETKT
jgi:hypothetical protein